MSYQAKHAVTLESIKTDLECDDDMADRVLQICERGYRMGLDGWYVDGDFGSDADYCYGVGADIGQCETELGDDACDSVFDLFRDAHGHGCADGGHYDTDDADSDATDDSSEVAS